MKIFRNFDIEWHSKESLGKTFIHFDLFGICFNIHLFLQKSEGWGYSQSWYDGPIHEFGLGRLLFVCTSDEDYIHR